MAEMALMVQRLVDRRGELVDRSAFEALVEPVEPLVGHLERHARAVVEADRALAEIDEGTIARALAASEARREPRSRREPLLESLDRLRALEDSRTRHMEGLLEAASLLRRVAELGLGERDPVRTEEVLRALALAEIAE
jgi:hypothetical protein